LVPSGLREAGKGRPAAGEARLSQTTWQKGVKEMKDLFTKVKSFIQEEDGASAVEYGLLVAGIAVVVMTAIYLIGTNLNTKFEAVAGRLGG
jgi:pilus assembly protein Flp/PilA